jgi:hypothetical protein
MSSPGAKHSQVQLIAIITKLVAHYQDNLLIIVRVNVKKFSIDLLCFC